MRKSGNSKTGVRVGDEALRAKTGKTWKEWFVVLDQAGARKMNHTEMAAYLYKELRCPGWWNQMVAVGYEQARGLREKHQKPSGYEISRSKVVEVSLARLYAAWQDKKARGRWLNNSAFRVRKETSNKSMRITWGDGKSSVEVNFYSKGDGKSQVTVQHGKLADAMHAERMKTYWAAQLDRLKEFLEP